MPMLLPIDERRQIARLFNFLLMGEQIAQDCASRQSRLFKDPLAQRFLQAQARQEGLHAKIFKAGIGILSPRGVGEPLARKQMEQYRTMLDKALLRGDALESLLGMQVIFEGLGEVALTRISAGFASRNLAFERVRKLVVGQEDAHHSFGLRQFQQLSSTTNNKLPGLRQQGQLYLEILDDTLRTLEPLFDYFDENPQDYLAELKQVLPPELELLPR